MSEELTTPIVTEEPAIEAPEAPAQPEVDPDILALAAKMQGIDPEVLKEMENLSEFKKRVNRKSMEAAEMLKQAQAALATAPTPAVAEDDDAELDDAAQNVLRKFMQKEFAPVLSTIIEERKETNQKLWEDFTNKHEDVPSDAIAEAFYELGFDQTANTPAKYAAAIEKSYRYARANTVDVDALAEQKAVEKLAALKQGGGDVVAVREKKSGVEPTPVSDADVIENPDMPWDKMFKFLNR